MATRATEIRQSGKAFVADGRIMRKVGVVTEEPLQLDSGRSNGCGVQGLGQVILAAGVPGVINVGTGILSPMKNAVLWISSTAPTAGADFVQALTIQGVNNSEINAGRPIPLENMNIANRKARGIYIGDLGTDVSLAITILSAAIATCTAWVSELGVQTETISEVM